jgi:branched-chain amino acid transport system substrate-binding protein
MRRDHSAGRFQISRYLLLFCGVLICFAAGLVRAAEPVRIGLTLGLTGKYAPLALMQQRGYSLWQSEINEKGGLLGRPVEFIFVDDESDPAKALDLYTRLIMKDRVDLVSGPYSSTITSAVAPVVDKAGFPMLVAGAAADKIWQQGYTNLFGVFTPASRYTVGMLNLALLNDLTTIAITFASDEFSITVAEGTKKWASKLGLDVVMFQKFKKGERDLSALAEKAKLAGPALLIVSGHFNESVDMRRALKKVGWHPKAYFATVGPVLAEFHETLGADADLTFASSLWEPELNFPRSRQFTAAFRARYGLTPTYHAAETYAAGQILEAAITSAASLKRDRIRQALSELQTHTVLGRYLVDSTGMQVKHFALTIQWQNGKKEIVWPEEVRTAQPIFE